MADFEDVLRRVIERELQKDLSWQYVPQSAREEIIRMRLERLAEWLVVQFELARGYR